MCVGGVRSRVYVYGACLFYVCCSDCVNVCCVAAVVKDGVFSLGVLKYVVLSNHVLLGLSTGLLPSTLYSIHFFTQSSSLFLITCPYHLSLPLLITVVMGSTPTSFLNYSLVLLSFMEIPHIHLIICISALSNFKPNINQQGHSLTSINYDAFDTTGIHSTWQLWMSEISQNIIHPFLILAVAVRSDPSRVSLR